MALLLHPTACRTPMPRPDALADPGIRDTFHELVQSLLAGEDSASGETPEAFRGRMEGLAERLERTAYAAA